MIRFFAEHKTAANLLMFFVFLLGFLSLGQMIRETFPEFRVDKVSVKVIYKGATSSDVETSICQVIEEELFGLEGVEKIVSKSSEGMGIVTAEVVEGYNVDELYRDIKNEVDQLTSLPDAAEEAIVYVEKKRDPVISLGLAAKGDWRHLKELAERLRKEMIQTPEISLVEVQGISPLEIEIQVRQQTLKVLDLDLVQLREIIRAQSQDWPVGSIEGREGEILLRVMDQKYSPEKFGDLVILSDSEGSQIRLRDIAHLKWTHQRKEEAIYLNGKRALILSVSKTSSEDALKIRQAVQNFAKEKKAHLPPSVEIHLIEDMASIVQDRLDLLLENALIGFILVFFTLWLFLNFRLALWVAIGIPFSFLGAIWLMNLWGLTLNMITMVSLILGLGLIVDDAIVMGENIYAHVEKGKAPLEASISGVWEVASGVTSSFLTTIAAFLPLMYMKGQMGKVLAVLPLGVILALGISLIEAFLILPNHLAHSLPQPGEKERPPWLRRQIEKGINYFIENIFSPALGFFLKHRYLTCTAILGLFFFSLGLMAGGRIYFVPFPELDGDVIQGSILLPDGTPLKSTEEVARRLEKALHKINDEWTPLQPGKKSLVKNITVHLGVNNDADARGSHAATVRAELLTSEKRHHTSDEILQRWQQIVAHVADVVNLKYSEPNFTPAGKAFEFEISGSHLGQIDRVSRKIKEKLASYQGVYNVQDNLYRGRPEYHFSALPRARTLGMTSQQIAGQLQAAFFGAKVQEFQKGPDNVELRLRLADSDRNSRQDLENFYLTDGQGRQIPLLTVVKISRERGYTNIYHVNGRRTVTVTADIDNRRGNAAMITADLEKNFFPQLEKEFRGATINTAGQKEETAKTASSVRTGLIIGLFGIFAILSFVFGSYLQPLTVMVAIPLGLVGAIFGHLAMGYSFCMPSVVGVVSLCGIVVNDSIVLVQFLNQNLAEGQAPLQAAQNASIARFRAVFLTSATTIAGLLPLMLEKSLQAQVLIPLAISVAFGLLFATVLILIFIPCLTGVFFDWGLLDRENI